MIGNAITQLQFAFKFLVKRNRPRPTVAPTPPRNMDPTSDVLNMYGRLQRPPCPRVSRLHAFCTLYSLLNSTNVAWYPG